MGLGFRPPSLHDGWAGSSVSTSFCGSVSPLSDERTLFSLSPPSEVVRSRRGFEDALQRGKEMARAQVKLIQEGGSDYGDSYYSPPKKAKEEVRAPVQAAVPVKRETEADLITSLQHALATYDSSAAHMTATRLAHHTNQAPHIIASLVAPYLPTLAIPFIAAHWEDIVLAWQRPVADRKPPTTSTSSSKPTKKPLQPRKRNIDML